MNIDYKFLYYENVSSTNELATELIKQEKAAHGTVVIAGNQTAGKGQRNNTWHSEPLMNLTMSIILRPKKISPVKQFYISKIISLAVCSCLEQHSASFSIKWPNDIYYKSDKIAGILIEHSIIGNKISASVCGLGLNINQTEFAGILRNPVSLKNIMGRDFNIQEIQDGILAKLSNLYRLLEEGKFNKIDKAYLGRLYLLGKESEFIANGKTFRGIISGINNSGQLVMTLPDGKDRSFSFKEIEFV